MCQQQENNIIAEKLGHHQSSLTLVEVNASLRRQYVIQIVQRICPSQNCKWIIDTIWLKP